MHAMMMLNRSLTSSSIVMLIRTAPFRSFAIRTNPSKSRIVLNHSTHVDGLIEALRSGATRAALAGVTTFTPGRISRTRGGNAESLRISVSVEIAGGWKCLARRGSMVQELFITTALGEEQLQLLLNSIVEFDS